MSDNLVQRVIEKERICVITWSEIDRERKKLGDYLAQRLIEREKKNMWDYLVQRLIEREKEFVGLPGPEIDRERKKLWDYLVQRVIERERK